MMKMLWTGEFDQTGFDEFSKYFEIEIAATGMATRLNKDQLCERLQGKDVFMCGYDPLTADVLEHCPDLKLVLSVRDGPEENIDVKACEALGIPVLSSAGRCTTSVAELTFCLMMLLARPVMQVSNYVRENKWTKENKPQVRAMYDDTATELYGKTCGMVGMGRNGLNIAAKAAAFGMKVVAYDPYVSEEAMAQYGYKKVGLEELLTSADYVVVMARLTPETKGMIGREQIAAMKKTACLVNTARGGLVDNDALLDALEKGEIRAAALDAHTAEPLGADHREYSIPPERLIITPHMAGKTAERNWHQYQLLLTQYQDYIAGRPVRMPYTPKASEMPGFAARGGALYGMENQ